MKLLIAWYLLYFASSALAVDEVCYPPYGCFNSDYPFNFAFVQLPEKPRDVATTFLYFTRENPVNPEWMNPLAIKSPSRVKFNASKPTVMFTHGYIESRGQWWVQMFIDELLKWGDINVILCDWSKGATFPYHQAAGNTRLVGLQMAHMLEVIKNDTGLDWSNLHVVGFSIGAHVVGHAGRRLRERGLTVPRISGLDPAAPYFELEHVDVRLDETDADFVDIIHTDTKTLILNGFGTTQEVGHLDFFPNGGYHQLGCGKFDIGVVQYLACSHYRAVRYFMETINSQCAYHGYPCASYEDFTDLKCTSCPPEGCPVMGFHAKKPVTKPQTKFYLRTRTKFPYCGFHYKVTFHTAKKMFASFNGGVTLELIGKKGTEVIDLPSRKYKSGIAETHLLLLNKDIGKLVKVKVKHSALIDVWHLVGVVVKPMWLNKEYTACYNRWLNNQHNEVLLNPYIKINGCSGV